ncbi:hypothetical protein JOD25_003440 [Kurthia huakuii]|nr:hypothetical protein [Kurthia huakuii]
MITNETFWHYWRDGNFKAALECSIEKKEKKRGNLSFFRRIPLPQGT